MIREILEQAGLVVFPLFAVVIFTTWFAGTLLWIYRKGSRDFYDKMSELALDIKTNNTRTGI